MASEIEKKPLLYFEEVSPTEADQTEIRAIASSWLDKAVEKLKSTDDPVKRVRLRETFSELTFRRVFGLFWPIFDLQSWGAIY